MKVSVIIPVYNDYNRLKKCLQALMKQTYKDIEIIVIDNNSSNTEDLSAFDIMLLQEKKPGSYAARNYGIKHAKGEIIAFTDSDCIPEKYWIEQGVKTLISTPNCGLVGGKILLQNSGNNTIDLYEQIHSFKQQVWINHPTRFAVTANAFTYKSILESLGYFNPELKSAGDMEFGQRMYLAGYTMVFNEHACNNHPTRKSFKEIKTRTRRIAGGHYSLIKERQKSSMMMHIKEITNIKIIPHIWNKLSDEKTKDRVKVSLLTYWFKKWISGLEKIKLHFGGTPERR